MLDRHADALHRQERHGQVRGEHIAHAREIGFADEGINPERQMRPVLLDRGERQDGDPAPGCGAGLGDVLPGHLHPIAFR